MDRPTRVEIIDMAHEVVRILPSLKQTHRPPKMETSKKLMWVAAYLAIGTFIVSTISWFMWREFPDGLIRFSMWFCSTVGLGYLCKSGYENRPKKHNDRKGSENL